MIEQLYEQIAQLEKSNYEEMKKNQEKVSMIEEKHAQYVDYLNQERAKMEKEMQEERSQRINQLTKQIQELERNIFALRNVFA